MRFMLWDDSLFEKIVLNPAVLGLIQYLLGTQMQVNLGPFRCRRWLRPAVKYVVVLDQPKIVQYARSAATCECPCRLAALVGDLNDYANHAMR